MSFMCDSVAAAASLGDYSPSPVDSVVQLGLDFKGSRCGVTPLSPL